MNPSKVNFLGLNRLFNNHRDEYMAATGNSLGHLDEYWELIRNYPRLTGGAIWDWISPGITSKLVVTTPELVPQHT